MLRYLTLAVLICLVASSWSMPPETLPANPQLGYQASQAVNEITYYPQAELTSLQNARVQPRSVTGARIEDFDPERFLESVLGVSDTNTTHGQLVQFSKETVALALHHKKMELIDLYQREMDMFKQTLIEVAFQLKTCDWLCVKDCAMRVFTLRERAACLDSCACYNGAESAISKQEKILGATTAFVTQEEAEGLVAPAELPAAPTEPILNAIAPEPAVTEEKDASNTVATVEDTVAEAPVEVPAPIVQEVQTLGAIQPVEETVTYTEKIAIVEEPILNATQPVETIKGAVQSVEKVVYEVAHEEVTLGATSSDQAETLTISEHEKLLADFKQDLLTSMRSELQTTVQGYLAQLKSQDSGVPQAVDAVIAMKPVSVEKKAVEKIALKPAFLTEKEWVKHQQNEFTAKWEAEQKALDLELEDLEFSQDRQIELLERQQKRLEEERKRQKILLKFQHSLLGKTPLDQYNLKIKFAQDQQMALKDRIQSEVDFIVKRIEDSRTAKSTDLDSVLSGVASKLDCDVACVETCSGWFTKLDDKPLCLDRCGCYNMTMPKITPPPPPPALVATHTTVSTTSQHAAAIQAFANDYDHTPSSTFSFLQIALVILFLGCLAYVAKRSKMFRRSEQDSEAYLLFQ